MAISNEKLRKQPPSAQMKVERIEFVASPRFKAKLQKEAAIAGISVGKLIRQRFDTSDEQQELAKSTATLKKATYEAQQEWSQAFKDMDTLLAELQSRRI
jgi:hypothetical protein